MRKHLVELLTPRQDSEKFEADLEVFRQRYEKILAHNAMVTVPDNPMGNLHFSSLEVLEHLELAPGPDEFLLHLNTFHTKRDLHQIMDTAAAMGIRSVLCVSGDGSPRLPRLAPDDIGAKCETVTSVELIAYIHRQWPGKFRCGVAFNPYEPFDHEIAKLHRKAGAGMEFIITQPIIRKMSEVDALAEFKVPVWVSAWMSKRIDLLYQCVGIEPPQPLPPFEPEVVLADIRRAYPEAGIYYSLLGFKREWTGLMV